MLAGSIAAECGTYCLPTPGAFAGVPGSTRRSDVTCGIAATPWLARSTSGPAAGDSVFAARKRRSLTPSLAAKVLGHTTVRKQQHNYMTRVIANGDGVPGPHRRRVPV